MSGGDAENEDILALLRPLLMDAGQQEVSLEEEEAIGEVEDELMSLCDKLEAIEDAHGRNANDWNEAAVKDAKGIMVEMCGVLKSESMVFEEKFVRDFNGAAGKRLHRVRKYFTSHHPDRIETIVGMGLLPGVDVILSCLGLYCLRSMWSSMMDPDYPGTRDPLGLGFLRINFEDLGVGRNVERITELATNPVQLTGPPAVQRALATSLLRVAIRDVDVCYEFVDNPTNAKNMLARLWSYWFGPSRPSPRRPTRRPKSGETPSAPTTPVTPKAPDSRVTLSLRRRETRPSTPSNPPPQPAPEQKRPGDEPEAPKPKRRGLANRLKLLRPTDLIHENTLFPTGCNSKAPPAITLCALDTHALVQLLGGCATCQEILAPALQGGLLDVLLQILDPTHRSMHSHELVVGCYNLLAALLTHKKFALLFVDTNGVEQLLEDSVQTVEAGLAPIAQGQCGTLLTFSKMTPVVERFASSRSASIPDVITFCVSLLNWSNNELKREASLVLVQLLSLPSMLHAFDANPHSLATMVNALDNASKTTDCSTGLESGLCLALEAYLGSHLLLSTSGLWPSSRRFGKSMSRAVFKALPSNAIDSLVCHLEQPVNVVEKQSSTGPEKKAQPHVAAPGGVSGMTLLTRSRYPTASRVAELGTIQVLLRLLRAAYRWMNLTTIDAVLAVLVLLSTIPYLHHTIASSHIEEISVTCGLGLLLEVASETYENEGYPPPKYLNLKALRCIRNLVTPPSYEEPLHVYNEIWQLFRANYGVKVVLAALHEKSTADGDAIRWQASRILLAMCVHPVLKGMLSKLEVPKMLVNLLHEGPLSETGHFPHFKKACQLTVGCLTDAGGGADAAWTLDMDHALQRLEKNVVVQNTDIEFYKSEMMQIVHAYLKSEGMDKAAAVLKKETGLQLPKKGSTLRPLCELSDIVKSFLRQQTLNACSNPISTLPTFSLRKGTQPALRAANEKPSSSSNVAVRIRQRMLGNRTKLHSSYDRKLVYSRLKSQLLTRGDAYSATISLGFSRDGTSALVGTNTGVVVEHFITPPYDKDPVDYELFTEPVVGIRPSLLHDLYAFWMDDKVAVHDAKDISAMRVELPGYRSAVFGNWNPKIVLATKSGAATAALVDLETKRLVMEWRDMDRRVDNELNLACTNSDDSIVLSDAVLYDIRQSADRAIHRYDKLTQHSRGIISASQHQVIIDKEVWDTRTHRLLCTIPSLASSVMQPCWKGHVIYESEVEAVKHTTFTVVDGVSFDHITTQNQYDQVEDFASDPTGAFIGCSLVSDGESQVKLYHVGRTTNSDDSETDDQETHSDDAGNGNDTGTDDQEEDEEDWTGTADSDSGEMIQEWD